MSSSDSMIGESFMAKYFDTTVKHNHNVELVNDTPSSTNIHHPIHIHESNPSLLQSLLSRVYSNSIHETNTSDPQTKSSDHNVIHRMMLLGPSKSGKTSLAMETAYSIASTSSSSSSFSSSPSTFVQNVTFLRHSHHIPSASASASASSSSSSSSSLLSSSSSSQLFPLLCRRHTQTQTQTQTQPPQMNTVALERMNIEYVSTLDDLIRYFAVLPLLSFDKRPNGAIVLDDLHLFFDLEEQEQRMKPRMTMETMNTTNPTPNANAATVRCALEDGPSMKLLQLVAVIVNSINYLDSCNTQYCPTTLIITWDTNVIPFPQRSQEIISNYIPHFATIHASDSSKVLHPIRTRTLSYWNIQLYTYWFLQEYHDTTINDELFPSASYQIIASSCYNHSSQENDQQYYWDSSYQLIWCFNDSQTHTNMQ